MSLNRHLFVKIFNQNVKSTPIVFLHGLLGSHAIWKPLIQYDKVLNSSHVILPDIRNHCHSFHSSSMKYAEMANDLRNTIDGPIVIVGHSMGARVGSCFACLFPDLVKSLVLIDASPGKIIDESLKKPLKLLVDFCNLLKLANKTKADIKQEFDDFFVFS